MIHTMTQTTPQPLSYRDAGVDISAGDELVERIKPFAKKTMREGGTPAAPLERRYADRN